MSRISDLISALNAEEYEAANEIYTSIRNTPVSNKELIDAEYLMSVL